MNTEEAAGLRAAAALCRSPYPSVQIRTNPYSLPAVSALRNALRRLPDPVPGMRVEAGDLGGARQPHAVADVHEDRVDADLGAAGDEPPPDAFVEHRRFPALVRFSRPPACISAKRCYIVGELKPVYIFDRKKTRDIS